MLVMGYLGAVIGAGFASGQEIMQFFVYYGTRGAQGVMLGTFLFAVCGGMLLYIAHQQQTTNYQEILKYLLGKKLGNAIDFLLAIFLFLGIGTMLSASGAVFYEHMYLSKHLGILLAYLLIVIILITGKKGLIVSYNMIVPVKIVLLLMVAGYAAFCINGPQQDYDLALNPQSSWSWIISSILYVAYNFALAMVVLTQYQSVSNRRHGVVGAVWGGLLLGGMVIINYFALCKFLPMVANYQVPMLYVAGQVNLPAKYIYTLVLWLGIITTAIANAYGFAQRCSQFTGLGYKICLLLGMTLALPLAMQSFSSLVAKIYPIFGILGISIMATLLYTATKAMGLELYYRVMRFWSRIKEA